MANDYINQITATNGTTYDIKDTISGYTTNTGTVTQVTAGTGLKIDTAASGGNITTTGTINHINSVTAQSTQAVYPIKIDAQGHISAYGSAITIPSDVNVTNTAVTATSTYYLTGSSSSATATGTLNKHASISAYVDADTSTTGLSRINLGNGTATGTAGAKQGVLRLYGNTAYYCDIRAESSTPTANRTIYLPSYGGTMYLPCMSTSNAVGSANNPVYVEATGRIVAGNSFVPTTGGTFSGAVTAAASDGTTAQIANVKYGSAAPTGSATTGTVYFQTGSSAYTFVDRTDVGGKSCTTSGTNLASFTLLPGLYLITYQFNCGTISSGTVRCDLKLGSVLKNQVRGGSGYILSGSAIVQCVDSSSTISFKGYTTSGTSSSTELHYSYVKLF